MNTIDLTVKRASLLSIFFILCSCAEVRTLTPSSRFISPESAEDTGHGNIQAFYQMGSEASLNTAESEDEIEKPMNLYAGTRPSLSADINIYDKINFFYMGNGADSTPLYGVKYQLMGPKKIDAKKGDQSLAITLGGGSYSETRKQSDDGSIFDDNDYDEVRIRRTLLDASVIYGKRLTDRVLWYSSVQLSQHKLHVAISDDSSSFDGQSVDYQTTNLGAASGLMMYDKKGRFHFALELSFLRTKWTKNEETQRGFLNGSMGFNW